MVSSMLLDANLYIIIFNNTITLITLLAFISIIIISTIRTIFIRGVISIKIIIITDIIIAIAVINIIIMVEKLSLFSDFPILLPCFYQSGQQEGNRKVFL